MNFINLVRSDDVKAVAALIDSGDIYTSDERPSLSDVKSPEMLKLIMDFIDFYDVSLKHMQWLVSIDKICDSHLVYAASAEALRYGAGHVNITDRFSAIMSTALRLGCDDVAQRVFDEFGLDTAVECTEHHTVAVWVAKKIVETRAYHLVDENAYVQIAFRELNVRDVEPSLNTHALRYLDIEVTEDLVNKIISNFIYQNDISTLYERHLWFNDRQRMIITMLSGHDISDTVNVASLMSNVKHHNIMTYLTAIDKHALNIDLTGFVGTEAHSYASRYWDYSLRFPRLQQ